MGGELGVLGGDEPGEVPRPRLRLLLELSQPPVVRFHLDIHVKNIQTKPNKQTNQTTLTILTCLTTLTNLAVYSVI